MACIDLLPGCFCGRIRVTGSRPCDSMVDMVFAHRIHEDLCWSLSGNFSGARQLLGMPVVVNARSGGLIYDS